MEARSLLRPLITLHMPAGRMTRWAEEVLARLRTTIENDPNVQRAELYGVHWGYMSETVPPPAWPLADGRWALTAALPFSRLALPEWFRPAAFIPPFEELSRAEAALRAVLSGWEVRPPSPAAGEARPAPFVFDQAEEPILSPQEMRVLEGLARGETNKAIAFMLAVAESTVRFHVRNIYAKLGAANRAEAVSRAFARGLLVI